MFKFFDPNSECFAKYDAFRSHIFDYACLRRKTYCYQRYSKFWINCRHQKHFSKWIAYPYSTPLYPPLAISYRNHEKSLAHFSYLAPLVLFCLLEAESNGGGGHGSKGPPLNMLLPASSFVVPFGTTLSEISQSRSSW